MLQRYLGLLKKDIITGFRNYFLLVVVVVALVFASIVNFVIPENAELKPDVYYYVEYDGENSETFETVLEESKAKHNNIYMVDSEEEIIQRMKNNFNSIGMVIKEVNNLPTVEFVMQGYENNEIINTLVLSMKDDMDNKVRGDIEIDTLSLNNETSHAKIPFNKNVLPIFLAMEPTMLGFVIIAAFVFMEKEEGTIRAYRVSPGRVPEYLASKITLMVILGFISTVISTVLVVGLKADYLSLLAIVAVGSIFASALGLIIASFFDNISQAMVWIICISIVLSVPFASYFMPNFAPLYIRLLPTYSLQFALREAIFPSGNMEIIYSTLINLGVLSVISFVVAIAAYRRNLARD